MGLTAKATGALSGGPVGTFSEDTARDGFVSLRRSAVSSRMSGEDLRDFGRAWEDLEPDTGLPEGRRFRLRRYGRMRAEVNRAGVGFGLLPHAPFRQDVIRMWRGQDRMFAPIAPGVLLHQGMRALVGLDAQIATAVSGITAWQVGIHLIRIVAETDAAGEPTPEGRHRDGHAFVGMHLLRRDNCTGGLSTLYPEDGDPVRLALLEPLDSILVDDSRVTHEVSPISPVGATGIRDMLLVDLNPAAATGA